MRRVALLLAGLLTAAPAAAQDAEGCKDHPLFTRIKGYVLRACETKFDQADIQRDADPESPKNLHPEGDKTYLSYACQEGRDVCLTGLEQKPMAQEVTADMMWTALQQDGSIALDIHFDTAQAVIEPGPRPIVAQIVARLQAQPSLKVSVDGHTDNRGAPAADNRKAAGRARAGFVAPS